jgi:hypothetical protein
MRYLCKNIGKMQINRNALTAFAFQIQSEPETFVGNDCYCGNEKWGKRKRNELINTFKI